MAPMSTAFATDFVLDAGWCLALELSFAPASVLHLHCWSGFALLSAVSVAAFNLQSW